MKEVIILFVVLLLVFTPNIIFKNYLKTSGDELIEIAKTLLENLDRDNVIEEDAKKLKDEFYKKENVWIMIVDHDMLDEIEYEVEECVAFYNSETKREFNSAANRLIDEIEDLSKREEISFDNIL